MKRGFKFAISRVGERIAKRPVRVYWCDQSNFGDQITPLVLGYFGFFPVHCEIQLADVVSTGSLLQWLPDNYCGIILGSGLIHRKPKPLPLARVMGVRGELTRELIAAQRDVALGDPGLLASDLMRGRRQKEYVLGLVPQYMDKGDEILTQLQSRFGRHALLIDVQKRP